MTIYDNISMEILPIPVRKIVKIGIIRKWNIIFEENVPNNSFLKKIESQLLSNIPWKKIDENFEYKKQFSVKIKKINDRELSLVLLNKLEENYQSLYFVNFQLLNQLEKKVGNIKQIQNLPRKDWDYLFNSWGT